MKRIKNLHSYYPLDIDIYQPRPHTYETEFKTKQKLPKYMIIEINKYLGRIESKLHDSFIKELKEEIHTYLLEEVTNGRIKYCESLNAYVGINTQPYIKPITGKVIKIPSPLDNLTNP